MASLAGCAGEDDAPGDPGVEGNGDDTGPDDDEDANRIYFMRGGTFFDDLNWNWFGDQHNSSIKHYVDTIGAYTRDDDNQQTAYGFESWDYDPDSQVMRIELRDDIFFWNGDQYTAEDLYTFHEMFRMQNPSGSTWESIEVVDDYTVDFTTQDAWNPEILNRSDPPFMWLEHGADFWQEWYDRYEEAGDDEEARDEVTAELAEWEVSTDELVDMGAATGAWIPVDVTDEYMDFEVHEDHWIIAGNDDRYDPNAEEIRMFYADETGVREQFVTNERVDWAGEGVSNWDQFQDVMSDDWEHLLHEPTGSMYQMIINWRNREYLQDINFRRAMASALHFENQAINTANAPIEMQTGMTPGYNEGYWGEEYPSDFIPYGGVTSDLDLADEYLSRSGYTREDGTIYDEDGEPLEPMRFIVGGAAWGEVAQSAATELQQHGFPIDVRAVDRTTKLEIVQDDMGDWDLSTETHFAGMTNHPHEFFRPDSFWGWRIGPAGFGAGADFHDLVEGWLADGETHSPYNGKPMVFDIPTEIGSEDLDGDTMEINIYELYDEIRTPVTQERDQEIVRNLSWAWNYMLPNIDITAAVRDAFGNTGRIEFADASELNSYVEFRWPEMGHARVR